MYILLTLDSGAIVNWRERERERGGGAIVVSQSAKYNDLCSQLMWPKSGARWLYIKFAKYTEQQVTVSKFDVSKFTAFQYTIWALELYA